MSKNGWKEFIIGDHIELAYGDGLPERDRKGGKYPVYGSNGVIGFHDQALVKGPGIIIGRKGTVGQVTLSKRDFWPIDTTYYVKIKEDEDILFWFYLLQTLGLIQMNSHSAVPGLNRDNVYSILKEIPPLTEQRAIAKILFDLDEKIELNQQMNKTLESIAQALFKQWFVDLEFPGYEKAKIIDGLPKGWEEVSLTEIVDVLGGGTPSTTESSYWGNELPFFTPKDISDSCYVIETEKNITLKGLKNCNSQKYPRNTVFITARGTVGKVCMAGTDMAMNQSCYAIRFKGDDAKQYYVYGLIKNLADQLIQQSHGTVFETITTDTFRKTQVVRPSQSVLDLFCTHVEPFYDSVLSNIQENRELSQIRDSLLPKLMSGKIRIA